LSSYFIRAPPADEATHVPRCPDPSTDGGTFLLLAGVTEGSIHAFISDDEGVWALGCDAASPSDGLLDRCALEAEASPARAAALAGVI
jgi:hypothetical protein